MKLIIKLLAILVIGLVALGVAGYFLIPPAADKAVDEGSRYAFGVPAEIGKITASPGLSSTSVGFEDYVLKGPTGFDSSLLSIGKFKVGVGTKSIIGDTKSVGELVLSDVNLNLIQDGLQSNLLPVLRHLQGLGGSDDSQGPDGPREGSAGPKLKIGTIRVENVGATISLKGLPGVETMEKTFTIPTYTKDWSSITGEEGKTVAEIASLIIQDLKNEALSAADGIVPAPALDALSKVLDGGLEGGLKGGIDTAKDMLKSGADAKLDEAQQKAADELQKAQDKAGKAVDDAVKDVQQKAAEEAKKLLGGKDGDALKSIGGSAESATKKATDEAKKGLKGLLGGGN
ncbi:hypothetical protein Poly30_29300 [Planctomycetes bacterium Poly30]|uniref:AsmA family protein n=1 Tax=Saltatorellus ferox TaxID=2528018 RepID=A0A518ETJ5_9BACT|nr:hypothetical protein Poly30_29300 [Planctomycetes bacterium Poly30]